MQSHHPEIPMSQQFKPPERIYTATGYGMVGQGKTPQAARQDLQEKMREAREV